MIDNILLLLNYKWKRLEVDAKIIFAKYGGKMKNDPTSYGNDIYFSTGNYAQEEGLFNMGSGRPSDFGIEMYQGNFTTIDSKSLNVSYIINPYTNLKVTLGISFRKFHDEYDSFDTQFIQFGIFTDLFNHYYDI